MTYDLIIISASLDKECISNTQNTINTAIADSKKVNVIVVETFKKHEYNHVNQYVIYEGEFNYNHALNEGLKYRKSEFQILANNDILFKPGWSRIGHIMRTNEYLSASALSNDFRQRCFQRGSFAYEGYTIGFQLAGWCIFTDKKLWDKIGTLDEKHMFWFSDNVYAEQLKAKNIKHALICSVQVDHLGSRTLKKQDSKTQLLYTFQERKELNAKRERIRKAHT